MRVHVFENVLIVTAARDVHDEDEFTSPFVELTPDLTPTEYEASGSRVPTNEFTSPFVELIPDLTPTEYESSGPRVPVHEFSTPYPGSINPDETCAICCFEFKETRHKRLVRSKCSAEHVFHEECLDRWVNDSAMENANRCPADREVICRRRGRVHAG